MSHHLLERARLTLLQLRVVTNERDEPLWPRRLSPRGAAMLGTGVVALRRGVSYLREDTEPASLVYLGALLPAWLLASMWITAAAAVVVLGPTRWWRWGIDVVVYLHVVTAVSSYLAFYGGQSPRGDVTGDLYLLTAGLLLVVKAMLNPPRPGTLPAAVQPAGPRAPSRRGKGRSGG